jgi:hypothetical protein
MSGLIVRRSMYAHPLLLTLKFAMIFGLPALIIGVGLHTFLRNWTWTVLALLVLVEICGILLVYYDEVRRHGTGFEIVALPGVLIGVFAGNLFAVPIARKVRSAFC